MNLSLFIILLPCCCFGGISSNCRQEAFSLIINHFSLVYLDFFLGNIDMPADH